MCYKCLPMPYVTWNAVTQTRFLFICLYCSSRRLFFHCNIRQVTLYSAAVKSNLHTFHFLMLNSSLPCGTASGGHMLICPEDNLYSQVTAFTALNLAMFFICIWVCLTAWLERENGKKMIWFLSLTWLGSSFGTCFVILCGGVTWTRFTLHIIFWNKETFMFMAYSDCR